MSDLKRQMSHRLMNVNNKQSVQPSAGALWVENKVFKMADWNSCELCFQPRIRTIKDLVFRADVTVPVKMFWKSKLEFEFITEFFPSAVPSLSRSLRIREAEYHCVLYAERNAAVGVDS